MDNHRKRELVILWVSAILLFTLLVIIAAPGLVTKRNRDRQKRSMADMRSLAAALEMHASDTNSYSLGAELSSLTRVSFDDLERVLVPKYIKPLPKRDAWGEEFEVHIDARNYAILCKGSDRRADTTVRLDRITYTTSFDEDLIFSNGTFLQAPDAGHH